MLNKYLVFHICKYTGRWMALSTSSSKHILNFVYTSTLIQSNDSCFKVAVSMQGYSKPKSFGVVLRPLVCWCSYINLFVFSMDNSKEGRQLSWGWSSTVKYKLKTRTVIGEHSQNCPQCKLVVLLHFHTTQTSRKLLRSDCKASKHLKKSYDM